MGIKLAIDDPGTGYPSFQDVNLFPLEILKIDRPFVKGLPVSADSGAVVNAFLALAKNLNLSTFAKGIETMQQKTFLGYAMCKAVQVPFLTKPMPVGDSQKFWEQGNRLVQ